MFNKMSLRKGRNSENCGTATVSASKSKVKRKTDDVESELLDSLSSSIVASTRRDSLIGAELDNLVPNPVNQRFGQKVLLESISDIQAMIEEYCIQESAEYVPSIKELEFFAHQSKRAIPELPQAAKDLYNNCVELANTFIENQGHADTPIKVYPAQAGSHLIKTGHRRYIAYQLARPLTGISMVDVLIDKSHKSGGDVAKEAVSRITENTARVGNTLAENLYALKPIVEVSLKDTGKVPNKSKLSRQTGIERTQLGRMIDMIQQGAAEDHKILLALHDHNIEDVTSAQLLFSKPSDQWLDLIKELATVGAVKFRERVRNGSQHLNEEMSEAVEKGHSIERHVSLFDSLGASNKSSQGETYTEAKKESSTKSSNNKKLKNRDEGAQVLLNGLSKRFGNMLLDLPQNTSPFKKLILLVERLAEKS